MWACDIISRASKTDKEQQVASNMMIKHSGSSFMFCLMGFFCIICLFFCFYNSSLLTFLQILFPPLQHLNLPPGDHYTFTWFTVFWQEGRVQIIYIAILPAAAEADCFIREEAVMRELIAPLQSFFIYSMIEYVPWSFTYLYNIFSLTALTEVKDPSQLTCGSQLIQSESGCLESFS